MDKPALNEYVETKRRRVATLANEILAGTVDILEASIEIHGLRSQVDVGDDDQDFAAFLLVASETDALPIGAQRAYWSEDALARKEPELERARGWAKQTVERECRNLVARFGG